MSFDFIPPETKQKFIDSHKGECQFCYWYRCKNLDGCECSKDGCMGEKWHPISFSMLDYMLSINEIVNSNIKPQLVSRKFSKKESVGDGLSFSKNIF